MAGTNIVAARIALIAAIGDLSGLDGVSVSYSYVAKYADLGNREYIFGGPKSDAAIALSAMQDSGRIKRDEEPTWSLHLRVVKPGQTDTQAGDERVVALGAEVENYVAANPRLDLTVTGLRLCKITGFTLQSWTDEKQSYSELDYSLLFDSYLA
jgi:hypothetical protein